MCKKSNKIFFKIKIKPLFIVPNYADGLVLPRGAPVSYGSGEMNENWRSDDFEPGEIVFGVSQRTPAAQKVLAKAPLKAKVDIGVDGEMLPGIHWGDGIVLLDRDSAFIRER